MEREKKWGALTVIPKHNNNRCDKNADSNGQDDLGWTKMDNIKVVMEQNLWGKNHLEKPKTKWENLVKKDVQSLGGGTNLKEKAVDKEEWKSGYEIGWSWKPYLTSTWNKQ